MGLHVALYGYTASTADDRTKVRPDHAAFLADLDRRGHLVLSGPYPDGSGALLMVRAENAAQCRTLLDADPFWKAGLIDDREFRGFLVGFGLPDETDRVPRPPVRR